LAATLFRYALPLVAGLLLEVGGLEFPAAPFAGWYTSVEIATRNLLEPNRYGLQEEIGQLLGLDTGSNANLWKDRVALEMNTAVLHSFAKSGATIVDQHTVSEQFQTHYNEELKTRGGCPADWVWLTPSQSGSLTPLYHQEMLHYNLSPALERQVYFLGYF
jgi:nitric oxide synthase oxygenase domain/subunit